MFHHLYSDPGLPNHSPIPEIMYSLNVPLEHLFYDYIKAITGVWSQLRKVMDVRGATMAQK